MALRALGRSRVMTARPLGKTLPFTNSSAAPPAMATKYRGEFTTLIKGFRRIKLEGCVNFDLEMKGWGDRRKVSSLESRARMM